MSFSFLSGLANLLPGYIQGRQKAIEDNWNDLNQYNKVQSGQIQNAFNEATFAPRVDMVNTNANMGQLGYLNDLWTTQLNQARMPGLMTQVGVQNAFAEPAAYMQMMQQWMPMLYGMQLFPQLMQLDPRTMGQAATTLPSITQGGR